MSINPIIYRLESILKLWAVEIIFAYIKMLALGREMHAQESECAPKSANLSLFSFAVFQKLKKQTLMQSDACVHACLM